MKRDQEKYKLKGTVDTIIKYTRLRPAMNSYLTFNLFTTRMVLGAVSQFLHTLLLDVWPQDRASVLLPGVRREVATQLVEFIYTGYMQVITP